MYIYALITGSVVLNIITLSDPSLISLFSAGYDSAVDITNLSPQPQIGWVYNGSTFSIPLPTLAVAIAQNLAAFQAGLQAFIGSRYSMDVRLNFNAIYNLAVKNALTNRANYCAQLFTWAQAVIGYAATYVAAVQAMTDVPTVLATTWDFTSLVNSDPVVSAFVAIEIPN